MSQLNVKKMVELIILSFAMICAMFAVSSTAVNAETTYTEGALYYTIDNNSIKITGYFGKDATVTVPSSIAGIPVNTIGAGAFSNTAATTVNLPDTITTIESGSFTVGTEVVSNYNTSTPETSEAADDGTGSDNTGADYSDVTEGDKVKVGDKQLEVVSNTGGRVVLRDAEGRTYHSNGSYIIDDETHSPLHGDVTITRKDGTEEVYTTLDDKDTFSAVKKVMPIILIVVALLAVILVIVLMKIKNQREIQGYKE